MIAVENARSGQPYLVVDGRHLSSSFDPLAEARKWVDGVRSRCEQSQTIFVLGLGSGYHIQELALQFPTVDIVAFESQDEVVRVVRGLQQFSSRVEICSLRSQQDYSTLLRPFTLKRRHCIVSHAPSTQLNPSLYQDLTLFLSGRHPDYASFYSQVIGIDVHAKRDPRVISICDLHQAVVEKGPLFSVDDRVCLILRELVK